MRQIIHDREMVQSGQHRKAAFGLDLSAAAHLAMVLRDSIYSDKIAAPMREYGANGWDAMQRAGKKDIPLDIHIPTQMKPELIIRDFGSGLSHEDVFFRYTQYGHSDKRDSDDEAGTLGLGCKSGFAYGDSFTVTSWYNGEKRVYLAVLDQSDMGEMQLLYAGMFGEFALEYLCQFSNGGGPPALTEDLKEGVLVESEAVFKAVPKTGGYWADGYASYTAEYQASAPTEGEPLPFHEWVERDFWAWAEQCGLEPPETGIEVKIAVKAADVSSFHRRAEFVYRYYQPQPNINIKLKQPPNLVEDGFLAQKEGGNWIGVMGCVAYRINIHQLQPELEQAGLWYGIQNIGGGIFFGMGEVQFNASREELKYSDTTKARIVEGIQKVVDQYVEQALESLRRDDMLSWEKRKKALFLSRELGFTVPASYKTWTLGQVLLWGKLVKGQPVGLEKPETFELISGVDKRARRQAVDVHSDSALYLRTDNRPLSGYFRLGRYHLIVSPTPKARRADGTVDWEAVRAELDTYLKEAGLEGLPIRDITSTDYIARRRPASPLRRSAKHTHRTFVLTPRTNIYRATLSENWNIQDRTPEPSDVFVVLSRFRSQGPVGRKSEDFYDLYESDQRLAQILGIEMPPVYGYKTTQKRPVEYEDCEGTSYYEWRTTFFLRYLQEDHFRVLAARGWVNSIALKHHLSLNPSPKAGQLARVVRELREALGQSHPITVYFARVARMRAWLDEQDKATTTSALPLFKIANAHRIRKGLTPYPNPAKVADNPRLRKGTEAAVRAANSFPLLRRASGKPLTILLGHWRQPWIEYLALMHQNRKANS